MTEEGADGGRPAYWRMQMEEAYGFMLRCLEAPIVEGGEALVELDASASEAGVEVAFSELPHVGGAMRIFALREGLIEPFLRAAAELNENGWVMKVEDGYRSFEMQRRLATQPAVFGAILRAVLDETEGASPDAELMFRRVSALVATRPRVATHMSGSAIDISVMDRSSGVELDRGGPYLEMSALTPMRSPFITAEQAEVRQGVTTVMARHGFLAYPYEFWHYSAGDTFAVCIGGVEFARYGPVSYDPVSRKCSPLPDEDGFVVTRDEVQVATENALGSRAANEGRSTRHPPRASPASR